MWMNPQEYICQIYWKVIGIEQCVKNSEPRNLLWEIGERRKKVPSEELMMICKLVLLCRRREHHSVEHFLQDLAFPQHRVVTIDPSYNGYSVLKIWQLNTSFLIVNYIITVQACAPRGWRREFLDPLLDGSVWLVSLLSLNIQEWCFRRGNFTKTSMLVFTHVNIIQCDNANLMNIIVHTKPQKTLPKLTYIQWVP